MNSLRRGTVLLLLASCVMATARAEEKLGRLFLTPERRATLEQQRKFNIQEQQTLQGATMSLDGVVVRSSGKKTVWINGRAQNDNNTNTGVSATVSPANPGKAALEAGDGASAGLRVGQKINRATREISDGLDGGKLEVKPPPQQR